MSSRLRLATTVAGLASFASRRLGLGRGETLFGRLTLAIAPGALEELARGRDIVLVSGTNGKTTTTRVLTKLIESGTGEAVSTATFGANMTAGITSALAAQPRNRQVVLECDELYLPEMVRRLRPRVVVLLNLSRDQLHRTGEVRKVAVRWRQAFAIDDLTFVIDRDDPFLEYAVRDAGHVLRVTFGGRRHLDCATCPECSQLIDWTTGDYRCECGLGTELAQVRGASSLGGPARNAILAVEAARLMGAVIPVEEVAHLTEHAPDRVSEFVFGQTAIPTRLAKNPESWRVAIASSPAPCLILAVNARGIDGRDTSWLWDIDFEALAERKIVATGERAADVAYRLHVAGAQVKLAPDFATAVAVAHDWNMDEPIGAIASYTAFQDEAKRHPQAGVV
jgi:UDP-N-acetylmuramyl tripeptide synthase